MHVQPLMMVSAETTAMIADGHGLIATLQEQDPRTLTSDASQATMMKT